MYLLPVFKKFNLRYWVNHSGEEDKHPPCQDRSWYSPNDGSNNAEIFDWTNEKENTESIKDCSQIESIHVLLMKLPNFIKSVFIILEIDQFFSFVDFYFSWKEPHLILNQIVFIGTHYLLLLHSWVRFIEELIRLSYFP